MMSEEVRARRQGAKDKRGRKKMIEMSSEKSKTDFGEHTNDEEGGSELDRKIVQQAAQLRHKLRQDLNQLNEELSRDIHSSKWIFHHNQICLTFKSLLELSVAFVLDKRIEIEVWKEAFKAVIKTLQTNAEGNKRAKDANKKQALLSWVLDLFSGFYSSLLLGLEFNYSQQILQTAPSNRASLSNLLAGKGSVDSDSTSVKAIRYLHQHILLHLGDLERYRNRLKDATIFYKRAISASPGSGQPYNQLALLEYGQGETLAAVFYYIRAIALKHPFPSASVNLHQTMARIVSKSHDLSQSQDSRSYLSKALYLLALCNEKQRFATAFQLASSINDECLTHCIAKDDLPQDLQLVRVVAIAVYMLDDCYSNQQVILMSRQERKCAIVLQCFLASSLASLLLPVYTSKKGQALLSYGGLPAIRVLLKWLSINNHVLKTDAFERRRHIWPSLANLFTELSRLLHLKDSESTNVPKEEHVSCEHDRAGLLPEDTELHLFLPLRKFNHEGDKQKRLNHSTVTDRDRADKNLWRARLFLTELATAFCNLKILRRLGAENGVVSFEACSDNSQVNFSEEPLEPSSEEEVLDAVLLSRDEEQSKDTPSLSLDESKGIEKKKKLRPRKQGRNVALASLLQRKNSIPTTIANSTNDLNSPQGQYDYNANKREGEDAIDLSLIKKENISEQGCNEDCKDGNLSFSPAFHSPSISDGSSVTSTPLFESEGTPASYSLFSGPSWHDLWGRKGGQK